jgi:hypothetical protein
MTPEHACGFFSRYAALFSAGDGDAIADLWHTPSSIADSRDAAARVTTWTEEAPMRANMHALCELYADTGPHEWRFELRRVEPLGPDHAFVLVAWAMHRPTGELMQQFCTGYQLGQTAAGWRVLFCTAFQEELHGRRVSK